MAFYVSKLSHKIDLTYEVLNMTNLIRDGIKIFVKETKVTHNLE
jgi:hypothetical protein